MNDSQDISFAVDRERLRKYLKVEELPAITFIFVFFGCVFTGMNFTRPDNSGIHSTASFLMNAIGWGFGLSFVFIGTLFSVDRRIAARRGATSEVSLEGEFLRIREQGLSRIDRKMHLGTIAYYSVIETPQMRKHGIQTLIVHGTSRRDRIIKLPGLVDCANVRDLLLDRRRMECRGPDLLKPEVDTLNYEKYIRHMGVVGWRIFAFFVGGALSLMCILAIPKTDSRSWIEPVLFIGTFVLLLLIITGLHRFRASRKSAKQEAESLEVLVKGRHLHIRDGAERTNDHMIPLRSIVDYAVEQDSRQRKYGIHSLKLTVKGGGDVRVTGLKDCGKVRDLLLELNKNGVA